MAPIRSIPDVEDIRAVDDITPTSAFDPANNPLENSLRVEKEAVKIGQYNQLAQEEAARAFEQFYTPIAKANKLPEDPADPSHRYDFQKLFSDVQNGVVPPPELDAQAKKFKLPAQYTQPGHPDFYQQMDTSAWTMDQAKRYVKDNPPQTPEEEAKYANFIEQKKAQLKAIQEHLTGYDRVIFDQHQGDMDAAKLYPHGNLMSDPKKMNAFEAFAVPYSKALAGFFTRPFGHEPFADIPEQDIKLAEKDHPVASAIGKAAGETIPMATTIALAPESLMAQLFGFAGLGGIKQYGEEKTKGSLMDKAGSQARVAKETVKSAAYAPLWHYTQAVKLGGPIVSAVTRAGARGAGAGGIEAAGGATPQEAAMAGLMTAGLSGVFELTPMAVNKINSMVKNSSLDDMAELLVKNDDVFADTINKNYKAKFGVEPSDEELTKLVRAGLAIDVTKKNIPTAQLAVAAQQLRDRFRPRTAEVMDPRRGSAIIPFGEGDIVRVGDQIGKISKIAGDNALIVTTLGKEINAALNTVQQTGLLPQEMPDDMLVKVPQNKREYVKELFRIENPAVVDDMINNDAQYQADIALNKQLGSKAFVRSEDETQWPQYYKSYLKEAIRPDVLPAKGKPEMIIWMGLPGSGKSQLSKELGLKDTHVQIDPDDAKMYINETKANPALAEFVQDESAHMADNLLYERALTERKNIIWPKVGKRASTIENIIKKAREKGYKVKLYYNNISTVESKKRAYKRYLEEKRLVSAEYIDKVGDLTLDKIYDKVKSSADEYAAWNVNNRLGVAPSQYDKGAGHEQNTAQRSPTNKTIDGSGNGRVENVPRSGGSQGLHGSDDVRPAGGQGSGPTEVSPSAVDDPDQKVRRFITSVKEAPNTAAEVAEKVKGSYSPIPNESTLAEAKAFIASNPDEASYLVWKNGPISRLEAGMASVMINQLQIDGKMAEAIRLAEHAAQRGTEGGQGTQALYIYERLTPEGILGLATKTIRTARENIKQKAKLTNFEKLAKDLNDEDKDKLAKRLGIPHISEIVAGELRRMAEQIQTMPDGRDKDILTAQMLKKITDQIPRTLGEKISMIQTMAQLLNPKTAVRNLLGNIVFQGAENIADTFGAALDIAVSLKTGKRTVFVPNLSEQARGLVQGFKEGVDETMKGVDIRHNQSKFTLPKNGVFDGGVLGALEKTLRIELGATDRAFYQAAYNQSLRQQTMAAGVEEPTEEMIEKAHLIGLYRTFQDDNVISRSFTKIKRVLNELIPLTPDGKFGAGDMAFKYPGTPGSIIHHGIEYSPFGAAKMVFKLAQPLTGADFDQEAFVRSASRTFTGTILLVGAGAFLASLGIISGKRAKDKDVAATRESVGIREYQINISALKRFAMSGLDPAMAKMREGDTLISYDWMQPSSIGVALGANMVLDPKSNLPDKVLNLGDSLLQASETLQEQPLVSGVKTLTGRGSLAEGISATLQGIPASFVPTLLNQVRQLTDNIARNTKDPDYFREAYNRTISKIPGAAGTLPAKITPLGEEKEMYQQGSNNPFNVFLNPAFVSKYKPDAVSQMVLDIWENSGQTIQFPRVAQVKIKIGKQQDGSAPTEPVELTPAQYTEYQKYIGNKTSILFTMLATRPAFMAMDDDKKATALQGFLTDINNAAKIEVLGSRPKTVDKDTLAIIKLISRDKKKIDANVIRTTEEESADIRAIDE